MPKASSSDDQCSNDSDLCIILDDDDGGSSNDAKTSNSNGNSNTVPLSKELVASLRFDEKNRLKNGGSGRKRPVVVGLAKPDLEMENDILRAK